MVVEKNPARIINTITHINNGKEIHLKVFSTLMDGVV